MRTTTSIGKTVVAQPPRGTLDRFARPLRDLRISVTDRCNFRCVYCMPAEIYGERYQFLPKPQLLTFEEITRLARVFVKLGVTKLRLTGGEPLVRQDLHKLVAMLNQIEGMDDLTLTTNGYLLAQQAQGLREADLTRLTVSLDTLDDAVFARMNGRGFAVKRVLEGIRKAEEVGFSPIKVNAVVIKGVNDHTVVDLARFCREKGYIVRFIEYMDVGNLNGWKLDNVVPSQEVIASISRVMPLEPMEKSYQGEVADRWRYLDGTGEVGVISSVTQPFCGDCTRARLSPDGHLYTCLFATLGHDLKTPLRSRANDEELEERVRHIWGLRDDRYSEERTSMTGSTAGKKVEMYHIGG
ncbi:MAG: GTP 3',8-cyclase MoaA [Chloroflexi bacterium]|nr:GTP 3',8-cyclase MoaA [Chloroflexota bacterium]